METIVIVAALWALVFGAVATSLAARRLRSRPVWAVFGVVLGPIALAILHIAPPGRCPACGAVAIGWEPACLRCDLPFAGARRSGVSQGVTSPSIDGRVPAPEPSDAARPPASAVLGTSDDGEPSAGERRRRATPDRRAAPSRQLTPIEDMPSANGADATPDGRADAAAATAARTTIRTTRSARPARREESPDPARPENTPQTTRAAATEAPAVGLAAVYLAGSEKLVVGGRYQLVVERGNITVLGPLETSPTRVCLSERAADLDQSVVGTQIVITSRETPPKRVLGFYAMPGEDPMVLDRAFKAALRVDTAP